MVLNERDFYVKGMHYTIRSTAKKDAGALSALRVRIDGETENLDREKGDAFIDAPRFEQIIQTPEFIFDSGSTRPDRRFFKMRRSRFEQILSQDRIRGMRVKGFLGIRHRDKPIAAIYFLGRRERHQKNSSSSVRNK